MTTRKNVTDATWEIPNVWPDGRHTLEPGEEFEAPDSYPWGDPVGWDEEKFPVVKPKPSVAKPADK